jgi:hypothetical protein
MTVVMRASNHTLPQTYLLGGQFFWLRSGLPGLHAEVRIHGLLSSQDANHR